jgi:hypothetical protein
MPHNLRPATVEPPQQYRLLTMLGVVTFTAVIFALVRRMRPETQIGWAWVAAFAGVWIVTTFGARALIRSRALRDRSWKFTIIVSQVYFPLTLAGWLVLTLVAVDDYVPWEKLGVHLGAWILAALGTAWVVTHLCEQMLADVLAEERLGVVAGGLTAFLLSLGTQIWMLGPNLSGPNLSPFTTSLVYFTPLGMVFAARAVDHRSQCRRLNAQQEIERLLAEDLSPGR